MKKLTFDGISVNVSSELLNCNVIHIDFNGHIKVEFTKQESGDFAPTNAMNGWGDNCYDEIKDKKLTIE